MPRDDVSSPTVLLVDDEPLLRQLLARQIAALGCRVLQAGDGDEALTLVERHHGSIDLILSDVVMPRMNGTELAGRVLAAYPDLRIILMSAYSLAGLTPVGFRGAIVPVLQKPFDPDHLRQILEFALKVPVPEAK
jgi:two-component system cell cycle sensor histidine kinase/response regulator CckA